MLIPAPPLGHLVPLQLPAGHPQSRTSRGWVGVEVGWGSSTHRQTSTWTVCAQNENPCVETHGGMTDCAAHRHRVSLLSSVCHISVQESQTDYKPRQDGFFSLLLTSPLHTFYPFHFHLHCFMWLICFRIPSCPIRKLINIFDMIHVMSDLMKSVVCNILGTPCVQQGQAAVVV